MTTPRRLSLLAVPLLLAASLSACGGDDGSSGEAGSDDAGVTVLTDDQVETALLTEANLGSGFVLAADDDEEDEDDDDSSMGCLDDLDSLTDQAGSETDDEVSFEAANELALPSIENGVASFVDEASLADALAALRAAFESCGSIDETDADGTRTQLQLTVTDDPLGGEVDEQVDVQAVGTITSPEFEVPLVLQARIMRVDNHAVFIGHIGVEEGTGVELDAVSRAAVDRVIAVAAGEEPSDEPIAELAEIVTG